MLVADYICSSEVAASNDKNLRPRSN